MGLRFNNIKCPTSVFHFGLLMTSCDRNISTSMCVAVAGENTQLLSQLGTNISFGLAPTFMVTAGLI